MPPPLHSRRPRPQDFDRQRWDRLRKLPRTAKTAPSPAVYDDDGPKLRELVAAGTSTSTSTTPYSALRSGLAVDCDDVTALDILLKAGTNPFSILRDAASFWCVDVVRLALARFTFSTLNLNRALSTAVTFPPDNLDTPYEGLRALDYIHQQQIIHLLIDAGADPSCFDGIVTHLATHIDLVGALKALLERGADPNGRGLDKKATALHHPGGPAYVNNGPERHLYQTGTRMLLDHGASVLERHEK
ncbi:hypothetical protein MY4038_009391 [Beauveria bassiana]